MTTSLQPYLNAINAETSSVTVKHLSSRTVKEIPLPLPPLSEQERIVARIEELFTQLDKGVEELQAVRQQLKTYRQAVLKYAFEGKLTEAWREEHPQPPASELLEQIQTAREEHYTQEMEKWTRAVEAWEANGTPAPGSGGRGKKPRRPPKPKEYPPLTEEELVELPELPEGWIWIKLGNISKGVEYGSSKKSKKTGSIPVLRMGNIQNGIFEWDDLVFTDEKEEINQYSLTSGDILFNRTNSPELVGKTAIYKGERPSIFAGYLIRINQLENIDASFLNYFLNSPIAKIEGNKVKTDGVNQSNINGQKLSNYPFPLISKPEQQQLVQEIESRLSVCDQVEKTIEETLRSTEALRQSILKQAFEGRLV